MRMLVEFEKTERIRHLGLLDMQRTVQRALRRSDLPIAYSNGFNPHILMSFASALSSGIPGDAEILDVTLDGEVTEEEALAALRGAMPEMMPVRRIRFVDKSFKKMGALLEMAGYHFALTGDAERIIAAIPAYLARGEIMAVRKSKSGEKLTDIRPMIHSLTGSGEEMDAVVSFTESATLKPTLLLSSLCEFAGVEVPFTMIRRTGLFGIENGRPTPLFEIGYEQNRSCR